MRISGTVPLPAPSNARPAAALGALVMSLACAGALALFPADVAVGGSVLERAAVPLRMLALALLATALLRLAGESWRDVGLRLPRSAGRCAGLVLGGYAAIGLVAFGLTHWLFPALGIAAHTSTLFGSLRGDFGEYLYWVLPVAWGSAAFGEEMVFRGYLQSRLERLFGSGSGGALAALFVQAAIFGALHLYLGAGGALLAGATGVVLGLVYLAGGRNLWACILLHGLVDTVTLTAFYLGAAPAGL